MWALNVNASTANNNWGLSVLIAFATGVWLLFAIPLFVIEKRRPGQPLPPNMNIVSVGFWQLYRACKQIWRLKQSLLYLIGEFGKLEKTLRFQLLTSHPQRLLPSRRLFEYHCDCYRNASEYGRGF
jgi:Vacuole effluxer Atg22 like